MRPRSRRCSAFLAAGILCLGCQRSVAPRAADEPVATARPRAPGVRTTRSVVYPEPKRSGQSRDELLWLRSPAPSDLARNAVREFLRAAVDESSERMGPLLSAQAFVDSGGGRQPARAFWQARFSQLDYTELRGQLLFRDADVQMFRAEDLERLPANRRPPLELEAEELAVRVPIRVSWAGRTRLFGDELLFRLKPTGTRYQITEIAEDFRLP